MIQYVLLDQEFFRRIKDEKETKEIKNLMLV